MKPLKSLMASLQATKIRLQSKVAKNRLQVLEPNNIVLGAEIWDLLKELFSPKDQEPTFEPVPVPVRYFSSARATKTLTTSVGGIVERASVPLKWSLHYPG